MNIAAVTAFIVAGFAGAVATIFKQSIIDTWRDWKFYKTRFLDADGDPDSPDVGQMCNVAGAWGTIIVDRYNWSWFDSMGRNVDFRHVGPDGVAKRRNLSIKDFRCSAIAKPDKSITKLDRQLLANAGITFEQETEQNIGTDAFADAVNSLRADFNAAARVDALEAKFDNRKAAVTKYVKGTVLAEVEKMLNERESNCACKGKENAGK